MIPLNPEYARNKLEEILSSEEYQIYYQKEQQNILSLLFDRFKHWIYEMIKDIFPNLDLALKASEWLTYGIVGIGILLIILFIYLLWTRFVRETRSISKPFGSAEDLTMSETAHMKEADILAAEGEFPLALRHVFIAFILYLDVKKWLKATPWKTNWEYYDELNERDPKIAEDFYLLAVKYEETIYGRHTISMEDYLFQRKQVERWMNKEKGEGVHHDS